MVVCWTLCKDAEDHQKCERSSTNIAEWSQLPEDLLIRVSENIVSARDFAAFKAVCKSWHSFLPCNPRVPTLIYKDLNNEFHYSDFRKEMIFPCKASTRQNCIWGSSCGWIVSDNHLINPLTKATFSLPEINSRNIMKVLVFKRPSSWDVHGCETTKDIVVMVIYGIKREVILTMLGCTRWIFVPIYDTKIKNSSLEDVADIVCYGDAVYGVQKNGNLVTFMENIDSERSCAIVALSFSRQPSLPERRTIDGIYLVNSAGGLWMIVESGRFPMFNVYRFDIYRPEWQRIESLGNHALLIGNNHSMSVPTVEDDEQIYFKRNCIYFTRHICSATSLPKESCYLWVFDMKSKIVTEHFLTEGKRIECYGCCWLLPSLN